MRYMRASMKAGTMVVNKEYVLVEVELTWCNKFWVELMFFESIDDGW